MKYPCYALSLVLLVASLALIAACILYPAGRLDILAMAALAGALGYGAILCGEVVDYVA